ncbi:MAG: class I tRNA ligase family protein [Bacteroides sp.]|nr:MAG: class I tRNA ligase family protein [Bacteroides sp.]
MEYNFKIIEKKCQLFWREKKIFASKVDFNKPKYYILSMFPYPSGYGLHIGNTFGYIGSDIIARFKKMCGFNVLHPMGYDTFGLPTEQYAEKCKKHPQEVTNNNVIRYRQQLDNLGLSYDWEKSITTSDPYYYKWTQWIFIKFFNSWYCNDNQKTFNIKKLIKIFTINGNLNLNAYNNRYIDSFDSHSWNKFSKKCKYEILLGYRLAYQANENVNWCEELQTVLANDEISNGFSIRGGYKIVKRSMKQWFLSISAYSDRLLKDINIIEWPENIKKIQKNWIGKTKGFTIKFFIEKNTDAKYIDIFIEDIKIINLIEYIIISHKSKYFTILSKYSNYINSKIYCKSNQILNFDKNKNIDNNIIGFFSGLYAINPFNNKILPIWIANYILYKNNNLEESVGVSTVDKLDYIFLKKYKIIPFNNEIDSINTKNYFNNENIKPYIKYNIKDAIFSRQKFWGEPIPIYFNNGQPFTISCDDLPLKISKVYNRNNHFFYKKKYLLEKDTMPSWAGSSWYYLRYIDPNNKLEFINKNKYKYWKNVDLYIGGAEHATGHLIYIRVFHKFLHDLGFIECNEPVHKLINQGIICNTSYTIHRIQNKKIFVCNSLKYNYSTMKIYINHKYIHNNKLNIEEFLKDNIEYLDYKFIYNNYFLCEPLMEKMSKSKLNVIDPNNIIEKYGADVLRLHLMFLGPFDQNKIWNYGGIEGVKRFINKLWNLFYDENDKIINFSKEEPSIKEKEINNILVEKIYYHTNMMQFNISISIFMTNINILKYIKCKNIYILKNIIILLYPYCPHICEELWNILGEKFGSLSYNKYPKKYFISKNEKNSFQYPIAINGNVKTKISIDKNIDDDCIKNLIMNNPVISCLIGDKIPKKYFIIKNKIINIII